MRNLLADTLKKKMNQESMIGYSGDSDDDLCNSSPEPPGQVHSA